MSRFIKTFDDAPLHHLKGIRSVTGEVVLTIENKHYPDDEHESSSIRLSKKEIKKLIKFLKGEDNE